MSTSIRFEVFGKVQGVWFRKYTMQEAKRLGIVGWVKNTRHLSVVGVAQGNTQDVKQL
jgi:acylphosphatase